MELMQGYVKDEGVVGVDSLNRPSSGSTALDFLSTTTSANSVDELRKVCAAKLSFRMQADVE